MNISSHDLTTMVSKEDFTASAISVNVSCSQLDAAIAVLEALLASTGNAWVKLSLGVAIQALKVYKATKGCP